MKLTDNEKVLRAVQKMPDPDVVRSVAKYWKDRMAEEDLLSYSVSPNYSTGQVFVRGYKDKNRLDLGMQLEVNAQNFYDAHPQFFLQEEMEL